MERLYINPDYMDLVESEGLDTAPGLLSKEINGDALEHGSERSTYRLELQGHGYFLKQVRKRRLAPALEALLRLQLPHHYAWREMVHVKALRAAGVDVMEVVAACERTTLGIPDTSAILVRQVDGQALDERFLAADTAGQHAMLLQLGRLAGKLHLAGFFSPVRMKDIIVDRQGRYVLIDRETRNPRSREFSQKRGLEGLRRFLHRQNRDYPDWRQQDSLQFVTGYLESLGPRWHATPDQLLGEIL